VHIVSAAAVFSWVLSVEDIDTLFADVVFSISQTPIVVPIILTVISP